MATEFTDRGGPRNAARSAADANEPVREPTLSAARLAVAARRARTEAGQSAQMLLAEPIAIVGMGCRFPGGANTPAEYWRLLSEGRSGIRVMPEERWTEARGTLPGHLLLGGYLEDVDRFDAEFFGIAPREAHSIDPQQRLLLEVCWEALADGGIAPSALSGSETGVYIAVYSNDYARLEMQDWASSGNSQSGSQHTGVGAAHSVAAGRLSFLLNLRGPCMAVDTACSSSLVAAHLACQSLRQRECDVALVGGSSLKLLPDEVRAFAQWGMLSSDGQAKTFDAAADGFVPGEGCGVIVLKRLSDAVAHGDRIRAVIRGGAVNHDGRSSVLTAPNGPAQEAVIRSALRDGQVSPEDVTFVEAHGTGTALGDPIEVDALEAVYGLSGEGESSRCVLGAVKTNFGHLEAAAGIAGLIKVVLALENQTIPRNLNFRELNPQIRMARASRLLLATEPRPWPRAEGRGGRPRFAGVSSFGLGGTNAHMVLEEAPVLPRMGGTGDAGPALEYCLPVSAHSLEALSATVGDYVALLRTSTLSGLALGEIAGAAARGRDHGPFRVAATGATAEEVADKIEARIAERCAPAETNGAWQADEEAGKLAFVFSGQGSLWPGMLSALVEAFPEAEKTIAECERLTMEAAGWSLRLAAKNAAELEDTAKAQPVLFAMQMALVRVLESWGIRPDAVTGHSVGEVAAAVAAGALTLEEGMQLVLRRGVRMAEAAKGQERGRMLAAEMSEAEAASLLARLDLFSDRVLDRLKDTAAPEIAAINGPRSVVFAGPEAAMRLLASALDMQGTAARWLEVGYAFHSAAMEPVVRGLASDLESDFGSSRQRARPVLPLISTVTGDLWQAENGDAAYWARGVREPVQFKRAAGRLLGMGCRTVVEIGPHPVLLRSVAACALEHDVAGESAVSPVTTVAVMRRGQRARSTLLSAAAALYERGHDLDWPKVYPGAPAHVELPLYRWNRQRYWLAEPAARASLPVTGGIGSEAGEDLPGGEISSPFVEGRLWQTRLQVESAQWLADHRFDDAPVLPFAAWLEIARRAAAGSNAEATGAGTLREFAVHRRLALSDEGIALQTLVSADGAIKVAARKVAARNEGGWGELASGFWESGTSKALPRLDIASLKARSTEVVAVDEVYRELSESGLTYGPAFRLLQKVYAGPGFALGEVAGPEVDVRPGPALHPALLDACLQTLQAARAPELRGVAALPVSVESYCVHRPASEVFALAEMRSTSVEDGEEAYITIVDRDGSLVAEIRGLRARRVSAAEAGKAPMWHVVWSEDSSFDAHSVAEPVDALLAGGLDTVSGAFLNVVEREQKRPGSLRRICLITRGATAVLAGEDTDPEQAALWGLARSFRAEFPATAVQMLDLPMQGSGAIGSSDLKSGETVRAAEAAKWLGTNEHSSQEAAWRNGRFFRPRLEKFSVPETGAIDKSLVIGMPGLLETLREEITTTPVPGSDEVQIECRAHGLNFRDVLTAMGSYAGVAGALGAECAGVVVRAGSAAGVVLGTPVVAFARGSMRTAVNVPVSHTVRVPVGMSFAEAVTIPVAFLTAHYGFSRLADLQRGRTVLIHSAAGGLGQAAVQLAQRCGVRVIATAGSEEKRAYLRAQGIADVFDSRSDSFAEEVLAVTGGQGVDVVLNALSGEKIAAGFKALRQGGVFLEVGKRDIWSASEAAAVRPDVRYWAFDLGEVSERDPALIAAMLGEVFSAFERGELMHMPSELYPMSEAEKAFRHMASGRHIGKLVLVRSPQPRKGEEWTAALRDGTALITGGTGALGLATARWLIEQGVRSIVLVSRRGWTDDARLLEKEIAGSDVRLMVEAADVADREAMVAVLSRLRASGNAPLRVVMHAAGEAEDRLLADHSMESFRHGMRTKIEGARLLEELTRGDQLFVTVYFSSAAALLGSAGQASYAAANAYLDGLAEERTSRGQATLSVNWGAWAQGGMVGKLSEAAANRLARQGVRPMLPAAALAALGDAILSGQPRVTIAKLDWDAYRNQFPERSAAGAFFADFLPETQTRFQAAGKEITTKINDAARIGAAEEIEMIRSAARTERGPRMEAFVRAAARKVLGLSAGRPMPLDTPMQEFGLDSLMALELRNVLAQAVGRPLSATLLFDYPSVRGLSEFLLSLLNPEQASEAEEPLDRRAMGVLDGNSLPPDEELMVMSDEDAEELLLAELDRKGRS